jgi:hypothetical protein
MDITLSFDPIWILIFFWTLSLALLCFLFGGKLIMKKPKHHSSVALGLFFIAQFIVYFTFPYIILDALLAIWAYKIQVIGYMLSTLSTALLGRSLTKKISYRFLGVISIPAILIVLIAWIFSPFNSISVSYGYELNIASWFFILLGGYGFPPLIYLTLELIKVYQTGDEDIRRRSLYVIFGYISVVISMTLFFTVLPIMLDRPEVKPVGILISTICMIFIYRGFRPNKTADGIKPH